MKPMQIQTQIQPNRGASTAATGPPSGRIDARSVLTGIAAEMLRGENMPEIFASDWCFCKTTPRKDRAKSVGAGLAAHEQCRKWALKIVEIARLMP